ncbi:glycosyl hydrolase [Sphingobium sp. BYY-5]|uniref:glycoside hydrolase n=1 Tax=Sphingobium sp. BYY-5 TaxID=2926400 RepID=UPI001FA78A11|nr:glycoside hydrolase [Sphingobium sp. BYY-5]MCI4589560.1 glycosyl hydrolase [Sphingobium sp. BYY-5]
MIADRPRRGVGHYAKHLFGAATILSLASAGIARAAPGDGGAAPTAEVARDIRLSLDRPAPPFEGWGTALAWFAHVTGGYPDAVKDRLADLFYGKDGLGWTIARYNIGGGNAAATPPYLRTGAAIPGFWRQPAGAQGTGWWRDDDPALWDFSADTNQRWWLDAISRRVEQPIFEAFSNSPPWFMTVSGRVSGAEKGTDDNLLPGQEEAFATYLAHVVDELQRRHKIRFRTLSPFNEPNTDYWFAANTQEGAHWSPARQVRMVDAMHDALRKRGLTTEIAAPDETNSHLFLEDWAAYPAQTRTKVGQLNVHSYGTVHQTGVRDAAKAAGIRLWMSENDTPLSKDPEDFEGMPSALAFAEHVVQDLKNLEPQAWVFWQAVETLSRKSGGDGSNWGLVKMDLTAPVDAAHPIHITQKYWAMRQFSRYIRPGYKLIPTDDPDTVAALSPNNDAIVLVHVNGGIVRRRLAIAPTGFRPCSSVLTDATHKAEKIASPGAGVILVPPRSILTVELSRVGACPQ